MPDYDTHVQYYNEQYDDDDTGAPFDFETRVPYDNEQYGDTGTTLSANASYLPTCTLKMAGIMSWILIVKWW